MNQKEMLTELLTNLPIVLRKKLVTDWLEDINWHSENAIFRDTYISESEAELLDAVEKLYVLKHPNLYSESYAKEIQETESVDELEGVVRRYGKSPESLLAEITLVEGFQRTLSYAFGWGIPFDVWESDGSGKPFADGLNELCAS